MFRNLTLKFIAVFAAANAFGAGVHADDKANQLLETAREAAAYAGAARYCKVDEDLVDEYIAKAEAAIKVQATDDYESMIGQIEFKNIMTAASAKEPIGGCDAFVATFEDAVKKMR